MVKGKIDIMNEENEDGIKNIDDWWKKCRYTHKSSDEVKIVDEWYGTFGVDEDDNEWKNFEYEYWKVRTPYGEVVINVTRNDASIHHKETCEVLDSVDGFWEKTFFNDRYKRDVVKEFFRKKVKEKRRKERMDRIKREHPHFYEMINLFKSNFIDVWRKIYK